LSLSSDVIIVLVLFRRFCFLDVLGFFLLADAECFSLKIDWSFSLDFDEEDSFFDGDFGAVILSTLFFFLLLSLVGVLGLFEFDFLDSFVFTSEDATSVSLSPIVAVATGDFFGVLGRCVLLAICR
jgi:hypothetical protein